MITPMNTAAQEPTSRTRWVLGFLAALITALAAIQLGTTASASAAGVAENRVRAHSQESTAPVGASDDITAGQQLEDNPATAKIVVATGVAANTASKARFVEGGDLLALNQGCVR